MNRVVTREYAVVLGRVLRDADANPSRWAEVAGLLDDFPPSAFARAIRQLNSLDPAPWDDTQREAVRSALRQQAARHLRFPDAAWAMPVEMSQQLLDVAERFTPNDPVLRIAWLFAPHVEIPEAGDGDWMAYEATLQERRASAVRELWNEGGLEAVLRLNRSSPAPWAVGVALADAGVADEAAELFGAVLDAHDDSQGTELVRAYLLRRVDRDGPSVVEDMLSSPAHAASSLARRALLYACLGFDRATWDRVSGEGPEVEREYWRLVILTGRGPLDGPTVGEVATRLAAAGHLARALDFLGIYSNVASADVALRMLERSVQEPTLPWDHLSSQVLHLLSSLHDAEGIDEDRVATLEWALVPFSRFGPYQARALERKLSRDPAFFAEVMVLAFRAEGEEADPNMSEANRSLASRAIQLLVSWHSPPGLVQGAIDPTALDAWVDAARKLAADGRRLGIADSRIGEVLAYAPAGSDGSWPPVPVRDLIERLASPDLDQGLVNGVQNARGATTRGLTDGGQQERVLEDRYSGYAHAVRDRWPRTGAVLTRIADDYRRLARRMDADAEWTEHHG